MQALNAICDGVFDDDEEEVDYSGDDGMQLHFAYFGCYETDQILNK
jgi:hypothetical protein